MNLVEKQSMDVKKIGKRFWLEEVRRGTLQAFCFRTIQIKVPANLRERFLGYLVKHLFILCK